MNAYVPVYIHRQKTIYIYIYMCSTRGPLNWMCKDLVCFQKQNLDKHIKCEYVICVFALC